MSAVTLNALHPEAESPAGGSLDVFEAVETGTNLLPVDLSSLDGGPPPLGYESVLWPKSSTVSMLSVGINSSDGQPPFSVHEESMPLPVESLRTRTMTQLKRRAIPVGAFVLGTLAFANVEAAQPVLGEIFDVMAPAIDVFVDVDLVDSNYANPDRNTTDYDLQPVRWIDGLFGLGVSGLVQLSLGLRRRN